MTLVHGKRGFRENLSLFLDARNKKSYNPNMVLYSQNFANSWWSKNTGITLTSTTQLAPDGSFTATTLNDANSGNYPNIASSITIPNNSQTYNFSIYVRKTTGGTTPQFGLNVAISGGTTVNLNPRMNPDTGVANSGSTVSDGIYWRWNFTMTNNSSGNTTINFSIYPATGPNGGSDNGTATGSNTVWGFQITQGATLLPYYKNNGQLFNTWYDLSGKSNNGTLSSGVLYSTDKTIQFPGADDNISIPHASSLNFNSIMTVLAWIKVNSYGADIWNVVSKKPTFNNTSKGWSYQYDYRNINILQFRNNDGTILNDHTPQATGDNTGVLSQTTKWVYTGITLSGSTLKFYINGTLNFTTTASFTNLDTTTPMYIGKIVGSAGDTALRMNLDYLKIYARTLTDAEVRENFESTRGRYGI